MPDDEVHDLRRKLEVITEKHPDIRTWKANVTSMLEQASHLETILRALPLDGAKADNPDQVKNYVEKNRLLRDGASKTQITDFIVHCIEATTSPSTHDVALLHAFERSVSRAIAESNNDVKAVKDSNKALANYIGERAKPMKELHHEVLKLIELFKCHEQDRFMITASITAIDSQTHHSKEANRLLSSLCDEQ